MNKKLIEEIINKATNKVIIVYVAFVLFLIAMEFYYQQPLSPLIVITVSVSTSLFLSISLLKSVVVQLFEAFEKEAQQKSE